MNKISKHINYREATFSLTAKREGIKNEPDEKQLNNMRLLAFNVFEPLRDYFEKPIHIASFFRCRDLNPLVGGEKDSQHMANRGAAMDIDNDNNQDGPTNREMFEYIRDNLAFDQLIWEYGDDENPDWVHVSFNFQKNRNQILKCSKKGVYINIG